MVWGAKGPSGHQAVGVQPGDAVDSRDLERFGPAHLRQYRRQPAREHGLACPGRSLEQQVVPSGRGDLEREDTGRLAPHIGQIWSRGRRNHRRREGRERCGRSPFDDLHRLGQCAYACDLDALDERRLASALARNDQSTNPRRTGALSDGERSGRIAEGPGQRQLAEDDIGLDRLGRDLTAGREHSKRERGVEAGANLAQERGSQVGRDPRLGESEVGVLDRRVHSLPRLPHCRIPQADDRERGQTGANVDLDPDLAGIHTVDREGAYACEHRRKAINRAFTRG